MRYFPVFVAGTDNEVEFGLVDVDVNFRCIVKLENIEFLLLFNSLSSYSAVTCCNSLQIPILAQQQLLLLPHVSEHHLVLLDLLL